MGTALSKRQPTIVQAASASLWFVAIVGLIGLGSVVAAAENGRLVYLPMTFDAEGQAIRTGVCLQVTERVYGQSAWWENVGGTANAPERVLKGVIAAIKRKDRATLLKLSHSTQGRDPKRFDEQATAFFQQFEEIALVAIPRAYEFDGLVVFFAKLRSKKETLFAPFIFASEDDGSFGFLPYRTERLTYQLVADWFYSKWGPTATAKPMYCTAANIRRATHRISLISSLGTPKQSWHPSSLFLRGASLDNPGELTNLIIRAKSTIEDMKFALVNRRLEDFLRYLTPEGGRRVKVWYAKADQNERSQYRKAVTEQQAFFLFDGAPLVVVYTKSPTGVQVMYFTFNVKKELLWTNSSYITVADSLFKKGPLYNAASLNKPFSSVAIK